MPLVRHSHGSIVVLTCDANVVARDTQDVFVTVFKLIVTFEHGRGDTTAV